MAGSKQDIAPGIRSQSTSVASLCRGAHFALGWRSTAAVGLRRPCTSSAPLPVPWLASVKSAAPAFSSFTRTVTSRAAVTAAAPAAVTVVSQGGITAAHIFGASSALMVPVYAMMAFFPSSKLTRDTLLHSPGLYLMLAAVYAATLAAAWAAGLGSILGAVVESGKAAVVTGAGVGGVDLTPIAGMFQQPLMTLLAWLHLLTLDVLMAREVALDGLRTGVATAHSVLLCFFFGPTGLISHAVTRLLAGGGRSPQPNGQQQAKP